MKLGKNAVVFIILLFESLSGLSCSFVNDKNNSETVKLNIEKPNNNGFILSSVGDFSIIKSFIKETVNNADEIEAIIHNFFDINSKQEKQHNCINEIYLNNKIKFNVNFDTNNNLEIQLFDIPFKYQHDEQNGFIFYDKDEVRFTNTLLGSIYSLDIVDSLSLYIKGENALNGIFGEFHKGLTNKTSFLYNEIASTNNNILIGKNMLFIYPYTCDNSTFAFIPITEFVPLEYKTEDAIRDYFNKYNDFEFIRIGIGISNINEIKINYEERSIFINITSSQLCLNNVSVVIQGLLSTLNFNKNFNMDIKDIHLYESSSDKKYEIHII